MYTFIVNYGIVIVNSPVFYKLSPTLYLTLKEAGVENQLQKII